MSAAKPSDVLKGTVLILVPHMDDEVLACGGAIAGLPDKSKVHLVYVTNGRGSKDLGMPGVTVDESIDVGAIREQESLAAIAKLGVSPAQARFLDMPDYAVAEHATAIEDAILEIVRDIAPDTILAPFRYDRHCDHVALNQIARSILPRCSGEIEYLEYFVYYRWKLLPRGDVRTYCKQDSVLTVDISKWSAKKKEALGCFTSQNTLFFDWQTRPVLSEELIDEVSAGPEWFLRPGAVQSDKELFTIPLWFVRLMHSIEPVLKRKKDQLLFMFKRR